MNRVLKMQMSTWNGRAAALALALVAMTSVSVRATDFPEVEGVAGNSPKSFANAFTLADGDSISGTCTGAGATGTAATSLDYFKIKTTPAPLGIYLHRMTLSPTGVAWVGTLRGRTQSGGIINPDPASDAQLQGTSTSTPEWAIRSNMWYGFGREEEVYYRIAGTGSTTGTYTATHFVTEITPTVIGPFTAGPMTFSTLGQTSTDTELFLYDSTLHPIPGAMNDDAISGFSTTQSNLIQNLSPGTYYLVVSGEVTASNAANTATNEASPPTDAERNGNVLDFPHALVRNNFASAVQDWDFTVTDINGTTAFPNLTPATPHHSYQVTWFQFTVVAQTSAPENDNCTNARTLVIGHELAGSTNLATNDETATCDSGGGASRDIWYLFDSSNHSGTLTLDTCGSSIDTVLSLYSGTCGSLTEIACNDDCAGSPCGGTSSCLSLAISQGVYYIRVSDKGGAAGEIRLTAGFTMDNTTACNAAVVPSLPYNDVVDNRQSTTPSHDPACTGTATAGRSPVWYTYTATSDCTLVIYESSTQDVYIEISTGPCDSLTPVHCTSNESTAFPVTAGTQYWIMMSLTVLTVPTVPMNVTIDCVQPPINDNVCDAIEITSLPFSDVRDISAATPDLDVSCNTATAPAVWHGVWYKYTPATDCTATLNENLGGDATWNGVIAVFTGSTCDSLDTPEFFCTDTDQGSNVDLQGGVTYYILVGRNFSSIPPLPPGDGDFSMTCAPPAPREACVSAETIPSLPFSAVGIDHGTFAANGPGAQCETPVQSVMAKDVWFNYTHTGPDCVARITVTPTAAYNAVVQVWRGPACGSLTQIGCTNRETSSSTTPERVQVLMTAGETYWIQFGKTSTPAVGAAVSNLDIDCVPAPANDEPCGATVIPGMPFSDVVDNSRAAHDIWMDDGVDSAGVNLCGTVAPTSTFYGVWYTYTPDTNCTLIISETGAADAVFGVFEGQCNNMGPVGCTGAAFDIMSIGLNGGQQYWILVGSYGSSEPLIPSVPLSLNFECRQPPANDLPCNAVDLNSTGLPYFESIDAAAATSDPRMSGSCVAPAASLSSNGVWYRYSPPGDCTALISETSTQNAAIGIYQGDCNGLNEVTCTGNESISFPMLGGQEYYILVSLGTANPGMSSLTNMAVTIDCSTAAPANDQVCNATVITSVPFSDSVNNAAATDDVDVSCNAAAAIATKLGVWYTYTPASDCFAQITETSNQDVVIAILSGPECTNIGEFLCTGNEHVTFPMTGNTQYWILIGSAAAQPSIPTQLLSMTFNCVPAPANDTVCNATIINSVPFADIAAVGAAGPDVDLTCNDAGASATNFAVWYQYTPANDCQLKLAETSTINSVWGLFTGPDCNSLTQVGCSISDTATLFNVTAGTTYWILVGVDGANPVAPGLNMPLTVNCDNACVTCLGDAKGDSVLNALDIQAFVNCALTAAGGPPTAGCECSDIVADGVLDSLDVAGLVSLMINPPSCP